MGSDVWYDLKPLETGQDHSKLFFLFQTAALYPGVVSAVCFILNFFIWGQHSSGAVRDKFDCICALNFLYIFCLMVLNPILLAFISFQVPFTTMLALLSLWLGISVPLVFIGYYFGYRKHVSITFVLTL